MSFGNYDNFTRRGNTLFVHVYFWPSQTLPPSGSHSIDHRPSWPAAP